MFTNKVIIGIGTLLFFAVATGIIMVGVQQRQTTRPEAQVADTFSCPIGSVKPDDQTGACPPNTVPIPIYPTGGGQQSIGTGSLDGGTFGGGDIGPTSSIQISPTPTAPTLGFCCMPLDLPTPTLPLDEPTPTSPISTPTFIPTPTSCPQIGERLSVTMLDGCSATDRCDFSVISDSGTSIATRSLWSSGTFDFGAQGQSTTQGDSFTVQRFDETIFTYDQAGTYDVTLTCGDTQTVCTKQITITDPGPGVCATPTPTSGTPSPTPSPTPTIGVPTQTPTPPACRIPKPTLLIRCPDGCSEL